MGDGNRVVGRLCLECRFCLCDYDPGWSCETPGNGLSLTCCADVFPKPQMNDSNFEKLDLLRNIRIAETCPKFEPDQRVRVVAP